MTSHVHSDQVAALALRRLWNEWDPIGVVSSEDDDEYDSYLSPTLKLLDSKATNAELLQYLEHLVAEHMGMGEEGVKHSNPAAFAELLLTWHSARKEVQ